jgi:putative addiction module component (TIGR02574 family)
MSASLQTYGLDRLSVPEKLIVVQDLWDDIAAEMEKAPLSDAQRQEVDRRLAAHEANPDAAIPWEKVEADALARLRK